MRNLAAHLFIVAAVSLASFLANFNDCAIDGILFHSIVTEFTGNSGQFVIVAPVRNLRAIWRNVYFDFAGGALDKFG